MGHAQAVPFFPEELDVELLSKITDKGQTTVPKAIRDALGVREGDHIAFRVSHHGVVIRRAEEENNDPAIGSFLSFLARDMQNNPAGLATFPPELAGRIQALLGDEAFDPDAPMEGDVAI